MQEKTYSFNEIYNGVNKIEKECSSTNKHVKSTVMVPSGGCMGRSIQILKYTKCRLIDKMYIEYQSKK